MTDGRAVLVTGAASGIGAGLARGFAQAGDRVLVADVNDTDGPRLAEEIGGVFVHTDVADLDANRAMVTEAVSRFGGLDVACFNAGVGGGAGLGERFDPDAYRRSMGINLDGMVFGANAAVSAMRAHGRGGAIVFTASIAGLAPAADLYYATAKHGLIGLMRSMAMLLATDRISVNAICPGFVDTAIIAPVRDRLVEAGLAMLAPADVAELVLEIVAGGETGQAWEIQQGRPARPVEFRPITLSRT